MTDLQARAYRYPKATAAQTLESKHMAQVGRVVIGMTVNK